MENTKCSVCGQVCDDVRMRTDGGAYGPVDTQTCRPCHEKAVASVKAESKRFGIRLTIKPWAKLSVHGAYSDVHELGGMDSPNFEAESPDR